MEFSTSFKQNSAKKLFSLLFHQIYMTYQDFSSPPEKEEKKREFVTAREYIEESEAAIEKVMFEKENVNLIRNYVASKKISDRDLRKLSFGDLVQKLLSLIEKTLEDIFPLYACIDDPHQENAIFLSHWIETIKEMDKLSIAPNDKKSKAFALFDFRMRPELKSQNPDISEEDLDNLVKKTWTDRLEHHQKTYIPESNFDQKMLKILRIFHPDMNAANMGHLMSQGWDRLSEQEKAKYA